MRPQSYMRNHNKIHLASAGNKIIDEHEQVKNFKIGLFISI